MRTAIPLILLAAFGAPIAFGQMRDNRDKQLSCETHGYNRQAHSCEVRETSFPSPGYIVADPGGNGGVTIRGWLRTDVLMRSRVEGWADTDAEAATLTKQIAVDTSGGSIIAHGPSNSGNRQGWSVSYEIFVPQVSNVEVRAFNGGIDASDINGTLRAETMNGGIRLARVAGDVSGTTTNGGVHVELMGFSWQGRELDLRTTNGGVTVSMPERYSAHVKAETVNGRVNSEFPLTVTGNLNRRDIDANVGSGGPLIHISTVNGGVNLRRS